MAGPLLAGRKRNGNGHRGAYRPMSDINVTPLVVTINSKGEIYLQETTIEDGSLVPRLVAITHNNPTASIYVRGDQAINYGRVLGVMSMISAAGFTKVSLVAETPKSGPKK